LKKRLNQIASVRSGIFLKPHEPTQVKYLQAKDFDDTGELNGVLYPVVSTSKISDKHYLKGGDVLFAAKGWKNFAAICDNDMLPAVASTSFLVISLVVDYISPKFLVWWLNSEKVQEFLKGMAKGTSIPSISKVQIEDLEIPVLPLEVQEKLIQLAVLKRKEKSILEELDKLNDLKLEITIHKIIQNYE
jgi:Restriction endonuclease S subunits